MENQLINHQIGAIDVNWHPMHALQIIILFIDLSNNISLVIDYYLTIIWIIMISAILCWTSHAWFLGPDIIFQSGGTEQYGTTWH